MPKLQLGTVKEWGYARGFRDRYIIDINAIYKAADDDAAKRIRSQPDWATTRCMILAHELWEYANRSHDGGVAVEGRFWDLIYVELAIIEFTDTGNHSSVE